MKTFCRPVTKLFSHIWSKFNNHVYFALVLSRSRYLSFQGLPGDVFFFSLSSAVFDTSIGQISDKYGTPVTPADWTFAIWGLIYTWQFALITYVLSTICRNNEDGDPLYQYPPVISYSFLIIYALNLLCNAGWCYVFCNQLMVYALVVIVLMALTLYYALLDNSVRVYNYYAVLYKRYR